MWCSKTNRISDATRVAAGNLYSQRASSVFMHLTSVG
jgi:hypothetical protein